MLFWLGFAVMTGIAVFAVLWPLSRSRERRVDGDLAVYRDQLDEIERDLARGLVPPRDAEAARLEVKRRLLAAAEQRPAEADAVGARRRRRVVAALALVGIPLAAGGTYLVVGVPGYDDQPLAARLDAPPSHNDLAGLVGQVEARLAQNPDDGRGWEVLAPIYLRAGRFADAVKARANAVRLLGATPEREADLGEAIFANDNGVVTADARAAFERALALEPQQPKARFFLGLAAEQDGRRDEAAARWRALLADAPADAPWRSVIEAALARLDGKAPPAAAPAPRGPTAEDVANADRLSPEERLAQIRGMVDQLAQRLRSDGSDVDGWMRLVRAHLVLGDADKARAAASEARGALAADPDKLKRLEEFARGLGLGS